MNKQAIVWLPPLQDNISKCPGNGKATSSRPVARQSGMVLIISLIILLLLTFIGISASQVAGLEEKMAGNMREQNLAFQAAETALRAAEEKANDPLNPLQFSVASNGTGGKGLYTTIGAPKASYYNYPDIWKDPAKVAAYAGGSLSHIYNAPLYIIEELPSPASTSTSACGLEAAQGTCSSNENALYRVTARGTGGTANAVTIVQSIFKR